MVKKKERWLKYMKTNNNSNHIGTTVQNEPKSISDIVVLIVEAFRKLWLIAVILMLVAAALGWMYYKKDYKVKYTSEATFSITAPDYSGSTKKSYSNNSQLAQDLCVSFDYLINNEVFYEIITKDLGIYSLPVNISITNVAKTNIISIKVSGSDPRLCYRVLKSVLKNYGSVTEFVVGDTKLTVLEEPGKPRSPDNPYSPYQTIIIFAFIGFIIGCIPTVIYALFIKTITSREDVDKHLNITCFGTLPAIVLNSKNDKEKKKDKKEKRKKQNEDSDRNEKTPTKDVPQYCSILNKNVGFRYVEAMRSITSRCERVFIKNNTRVIVITSTKSGEGKSTFSMNLAYSLSKMQKKVMLIDGDLRKPSLKPMVDSKTPSYSMGSFLKGQIKSSQAITNLKGTRVLALTPDKATEHPVDIINSDEMDNFIKEVKQVVDYIVIDAPPCSGLSDTAALAKHADGVIYVVKEDDVRINKILDTMQEFSYTKKPILGCIINGSVGKLNLAYGYGSHYGYGKYGYGRYGYGYGSRRYGYGYGQYGYRSYGAYGDYGDVSDREFKSSSHTVSKHIKMSTSEEEKKNLERERQEELKKEEQLEEKNSKESNKKKHKKKDEDNI